MTDKINKIKKEMEEDKIKIEVVNDFNEVSVAVRTTDESDFSVVGMDKEQSKTLGEFFKTYQKVIKDIYHLHNQDTTYEILPEKDTIEWCWEVGKILDESLGERTKQEKETFISPLGESDNDISKWKVLRTEHVHELFPEKEELPDIKVEEGSASVFCMTCRVADTKEEVSNLYKTLSPEELTYLEYKMWRDLRKEDNVEKEQIIKKAEHHSQDSISENRKKKAVERIEKTV